MYEPEYIQNSFRSTKKLSKLTNMRSSFKDLNARSSKEKKARNSNKWFSTYFVLKFQIQKRKKLHLPSLTCPSLILISLYSSLWHLANMSSKEPSERESNTWQNHNTWGKRRDTCCKESRWKRPWRRIFFSVFVRLFKNYSILHI
jgi:hypothetical protein